MTLGNERVIGRLVRDGDPLVDRVISWAEGVKKSLAGEGGRYTLAEKRRIDKALKLYEKAAEAAGNRDLVKRILALREEYEEDAILTDESYADENTENQLSNDHKTENMKVSEGGVRFSLKGINKDGIEVYETSEEIKRLPYKERQKIFLDIMKTQYRGRTAKFFRNGHSYYALFEEGDVRKNIYGDKSSDIKGIKAKINIGADGNIFELVENAIYDGSKPESGKNISSHKNVEYWDYFVKSVQIDNRVFDLVANVRKKPDNSFVYNIQLRENKKIEASPPRSSLLRASSGVPNVSTNNSITDSTEKVNSETKFSYKTPAESKVYKRIAEWEKLKVYEKADAEKMLYTILSDVMTLSEDQEAVMTLEGRKDAENLLWAELNNALTEKEMRGAADKVADFVISRSVVKSWLNDPFEIEKINNAEDVISHLKPYLHGLNLSHIKAEIKHKYDTKANGVMLMWGTKCDSRYTQASKEKDHRFGWSFSLVLLRELESRTP